MVQPCLSYSICILLSLGRFDVMVWMVMGKLRRAPNWPCSICAVRSMYFALYQWGTSRRTVSWPGAKYIYIYYIYHSGKNWVNRPQHRRRGIVLTGVLQSGGSATLLMEKTWMKWHNIGHKELKRKASSLKMYVSESLQNEIEAQVVADCAPSYARLDT